MANDVNTSGSGSSKEITYSIDVDTKKFESKISAMKKSIKSLSGYANSFSKHAKKITNGFSGFGSSAKVSSKAISGITNTLEKFGKSFGKIFKMAKLMLLRKVIRAVISNIGDGFKGLAMYSEEFDKSMSMLINSAKQLGYSISAMASPLLNALAPALTYIIQLVNKAVASLSQLFSALSGASTFITAKKQTGSWAESLEDANNSAKKLKNTVLGFDEINKLDDPTSGSSSGSALDPNSMFETKDIESKYKDLADKIKSIFNKLISPIKKAWEKLGNYVVSSWKKAFSSLKNLGTSVFDDFLEVWQQSNTVKIFENLLHIIGDIGKAVSNLADNFRKAWEKNETGKKIIENIRDIIKIISDHADNIADSFAKWTEKLNFEPLLSGFESLTKSLEKVFDFISGIIENIWTQTIQPFAKHIVEETIPKLEQVFTDFNNNVDWDGLKKHLSNLWDALEKLLEASFDGLVEFVDEISDGVAKFVNSKEFGKFIDKLSEFMSNVTPEDVKHLLEVVTFVETLKIALSGFGALAESIKVIGTFTVALKELWTLLSQISLFAISDSTGLSANNIAMIGIKFTDLIKGTWLDPDEWSNTLGKIVDYFGIFWNDLLLIVPKTIDDIFGTNILTEGSWHTFEEYNSALETLKQNNKDLGGSYDDIVNRAKFYREALSQNSQSTINNVQTTKKENTEFEKSFEGLRQKVVGEMGTLKKSYSDMTKDLQTNTDKIKSAFDKSKWTFSGVSDGLRSSFKDAIESVKSVWNNWVSGINGRTFNIGNKTISINLPRFATGGFPEDGLFMANHGEMVGKFSNGKTAVANNEQITTGIANAVYQAMMMANGGNNNSSYINNTIQIDGEVIARAVTKGQNSLNRRYNPSMA